jgi:hypothetical protein
MSADIEAVLARQPRTEHEVALDEAQANAFVELGFTRIERITTDEEAAWIGEVYDWLFEERVKAMRHDYFDLVRPFDTDGEDLLPQVMSPEQRFPQLQTTAFWRNGRKLASQLLRADPSLLKGWGHMIRKPAGIGEALPWHQDEAYWDPSFDYFALACWMPLDPATNESGCMSMIPGSHLRPILPHRHVGDDPATPALYAEPDPADIARAVPLPVAAGGAVLHHSRTLHCSGPNVSDHVRRAYANEWQLKPVRRDVSYERPWVEEGEKAARARVLS